MISRNAVVSKTPRLGANAVTFRTTPMTAANAVTSDNAMPFGNAMPWGNAMHLGNDEIFGERHDVGNPAFDDATPFGRRHDLGQHNERARRAAPLDNVPLDSAPLDNASMEDAVTGNSRMTAGVE